ncbi:amino acid ABC transporter permease [Wenxinia saemankumensis]|uniref:L-glutamine ABC transporter membrane protein /L-glutamate ABC transporter membrane protein /L-aspartate ABC transporter membrane protein /L-asparagine ABC transporter membrane protein n=1 Tax=Wenxinia saemankumensis TaxID=1447782 RepID=A0A1M6C9M1_9RHOB|nr:amino acid ABC transporter permease [Wenxinia saemankumensis]SHI57705.1 L-glutamine ABC transporter membrane protein /L-glutamate ABC transporter membrane protein /L-aspartate ABC transporter membrane protein /L-asparagine ABC transporter membrane protein [Wenxinia saemankumensis]
MSDTHAQTVPYVRESMLPQAEPPVAERGVVKWIRENLVSSWLNAILTLVSLYIIWWVVSHVWGWFAGSVWNAGSLTECREILAGEEGACFAVIAERWNQLVFGFYPPELYWRPLLALALFFAAIAPVLFPERVPRAMFVVTAAMPFVNVWLIWGGSLWGPIFVALGFVAGWGAWRLAQPRLGVLAGAILSVLAALLWWGVVTGWASPDFARILPLDLQRVTSRDIGGFLLSTIIGLSAIILSLPLGILLALGRQSDLFIINKVSVAFIEVIRGIPLIVWLFTAQLLLNYFLPPGTNFDLLLRVIIMVTLFSAAYIAEVVRGGLAALPRGQYEGADSLGLSYWQSMRLIILPQALKISIPGIVNTFIGLFKDTTLVVFIGLLDPIGFSNAIRASTDWNGIYWELFVFIGVLFFIFCYSMGRYSLYLEKKLSREHR